MTRARAKRWARALGVLALFVLAFWLTGCDPAVFWARRAHLRDIAAQLFPPDWSYLSAIVAPLLATLRMSVTGTALGVALALGFAPLCAHNLPCPAPVRAVLRFLVQVLRSFPALILALLATFLFGLGTFSGTVAILMNSHNLDQSRAVSSRLLGLHAGRIVLDCAPDAVTDADLARIYGGAESEAAP